MLKYNYKGAAALWDKYYNTFCDPWTFDTIERQQERRHFLRFLTRDIKAEKKLYIDFINNDILECRPVKDAKSRCFDFEAEREKETIKQEIIDFKGFLQ